MKAAEEEAAARIKAAEEETAKMRVAAEAAATAKAAEEEALKVQAAAEAAKIKTTAEEEAAAKLRTAQEEATKMKAAAEEEASEMKAAAEEEVAACLMLHNEAKVKTVAEEAARLKAEQKLAKVARVEAEEVARLKTDEKAAETEAVELKVAEEAAEAQAVRRKIAAGREIIDQEEDAAAAEEQATADAEVQEQQALTPISMDLGGNVAVRHLLQDWLGSTPKLDEYATTLLNNGYDTPEMLDELTLPEDLLKLGFSKPHANKVIKCVSQPSSPSYSPVSASDTDRMIGTNLRILNKELGRGAHGLVLSGAAKC